MDFEWLNLPVLAVATLLLFSSLPKIADPGPIAATIESLYLQVAGGWRRGGGSPPDLSRLGRLLGLVEAGVAAWVVLAPSWAAAVALALLGAGFAAAGLIGALTSLEVACACFGKRGRPLGYRHAVLLPVWVGVAWSVARSSGLQSLDERLLMLTSCVACVTCVFVVRMWVAAMPLARERRRAAMRDTGIGARVDHGGAEWLLPR